MRKFWISLTALFTLLTLTGCGPLIETLTVKTWPGNTTVNISAASVDGDKKTDFTTDESGLLTIKNVKFAKDANGRDRKSVV